MPEKTAIVYLYGFSTVLESKLMNFVKILEYQIKQNAQVQIVFIHDGVIGTSRKNKTSQLMQKVLEFPLTVYSMIPDLKARGIDTKSLQKGIQGIGYDNLVDILATAPKIVSWM